MHLIYEREVYETTKNAQIVQVLQRFLKRGDFARVYVYFFSLFFGFFSRLVNWLRNICRTLYSAPFQWGRRSQPPTKEKKKYLQVFLLFPDLPFHKLA